MLYTNCRRRFTQNKPDNALKSRPKIDKENGRVGDAKCLICKLLIQEKLEIYLETVINNRELQHLDFVVSY